MQVLTYLLGLKGEVNKLEDEATRINKYQALFKVRFGMGPRATLLRRRASPERVSAARMRGW